MKKLLDLKGYNSVQMLREVESQIRHMSEVKVAPTDEDYARISAIIHGARAKAVVETTETIIQRSEHLANGVKYLLPS